MAFTNSRELESVREVSDVKELIEALEFYKTSDGRENYLEDEQLGECKYLVKMYRVTLSDGSYVYNVELSTKEPKMADINR